MEKKFQPLPVWARGVPAGCCSAPQDAQVYQVRQEHQRRGNGDEAHSASGKLCCCLFGYSRKQLGGKKYPQAVLPPEPGPPALFLWPEQALPAGSGPFPDSPPMGQVRPLGWGLLLLSRLAAYCQLKLSLRFYLEQKYLFPHHWQAAEKKEIGRASCRERVYQLV